MVRRCRVEGARRRRSGPACSRIRRVLPASTCGRGAPTGTTECARGATRAVRDGHHRRHHHRRDGPETTGSRSTRATTATGTSGAVVAAATTTGTAALAGAGDARHRRDGAPGDRGTRGGRRADAEACCRESRRRGAGPRDAAAYRRGRDAGRRTAGPTGLGIAGRLTGCAEENGLLPTRGGRQAGLGQRAGPRAGAAGRTAAVSAAGAAGATGGRRSRGAAGAGAAGLATGGAGGAWRHRHPQPGRWLSGCGLLRRRSLGAAERLAQPARRGFHGGRRRFDELRPVRLRASENFLTGDTEFLRQLVYAGLTWCCHYISYSGGDSGGWAAPRV